MHTPRQGQRTDGTPLRADMIDPVGASLLLVARLCRIARNVAVTTRILLIGEIAASMRPRR
jgi:hypothetical protein